LNAIKLFVIAVAMSACGSQPPAAEPVASQTEAVDGTAPMATAYPINSQELLAILFARNTWNNYGAGHQFYPGLTSASIPVRSQTNFAPGALGYVAPGNAYMAINFAAMNRCTGSTTTWDSIFNVWRTTVWMDKCKAVLLHEYGHVLYLPHLGNFYGPETYVFGIMEATGHCDINGICTQAAPVQLWPNDKSMFNSYYNTL